MPRLARRASAWKALTEARVPGRVRRARLDCWGPCTPAGRRGRAAGPPTLPWRPRPPPHPTRVLLVRRATAADAPALAELAIRTFRATYIPASAAADVERYIAEHFADDRQAAEIADPAMTTLLGLRDGAAAAYVQLHWGTTSDGVVAERPVEIARLYVDAPLHGSGAAHTLMRAALDAATARGGDAAWLSVWERNRRAIAFYAKWGFVGVGAQTFAMGTDLQRDHVLARALP